MLERKISLENLTKINDGRIFTGTQAKEINLIDEIGVESDAVEWLKKKASLDDKIKIIDYSDDTDFFELINLKFLKKLSNMELKLTDGILAIWTP